MPHTHINTHTHKGEGVEWTLLLWIEYQTYGTVVSLVSSMNAWRLLPLPPPPPQNPNPVTLWWLICHDIQALASLLNTILAAKQSHSVFRFQKNVTTKCVVLHYIGSYMLQHMVFIPFKSEWVCSILCTVNCDMCNCQTAIITHTQFLCSFINTDAF